jgi:hypothetical protein
LHEQRITVSVARSILTKPLLWQGQEIWRSGPSYNRSLRTIPP